MEQLAKCQEFFSDPAASITTMLKKLTYANINLFLKATDITDTSKL